MGVSRENKIRFVTGVGREDFVSFLRRTKIMVGNSSTGIKECSYLGIPVVNIGTRQQGRLRGPNITDVSFDLAAIAGAIKKQLAHGPYKSSKIYYKPDTSKKIVSVLTSVKTSPQKTFYEIKEA